MIQKQPTEVFIKKLFLKISQKNAQISQKTPALQSLCNKVADLKECCEIFKNTYFEKHLQMAVS